ncbi:Hpt domain-containing protein [Thiohalobacter sp.]|uniref:Hpt domain-containing protein n=1 Tax=Thiohalobacter sp. TaxID=2025948 RepID=UPI00398325F2
MLAGFLAQLGLFRQELQRALTRDDREMLRSLLHKHKSSARSVGTMTLGNACAEGERLCREGDASALERMLANLFTEIDRAEQALQRLAHDARGPDSGQALHYLFLDRLTSSRCRKGGSNGDNSRSGHRRLARSRCGRGRAEGGRFGPAPHRRRGRGRAHPRQRGCGGGGVRACLAAGCRGHAGQPLWCWLPRTT